MLLNYFYNRLVFAVQGGYFLQFQI